MNDFNAITIRGPVGVDMKAVKSRNDAAVGLGAYSDDDGRGPAVAMSRVVGHWLCHLEGTKMGILIHPTRCDEGFAQEASGNFRRSDGRYRERMTADCGAPGPGRRLS